ncbi:unnamed protein product [Closterium sp. Naga37s-1]|nr:unnamed protein product [Closterium sp. Naga37s-1]
MVANGGEKKGGERTAGNGNRSEEGEEDGRDEPERNDSGEVEQAGGSDAASGEDEGDGGGEDGGEEYADGKEADGEEAEYENADGKLDGDGGKEDEEEEEDGKEDDDEDGDGEEDGEDDEEEEEEDGEEDEEGEDEEECDDQSPVEEVALTVATFDDPSLPCLTWRVVIIGSIVCALLAFINQYFWFRWAVLLVQVRAASGGRGFRTQSIIINPIAAIILSLYMGRLLARIERRFNPDALPFSVKGRGAGEEGGGVGEVGGRWGGGGGGRWWGGGGGEVVGGRGGRDGGERREEMRGEGGGGVRACVWACCMMLLPVHCPPQEHVLIGIFANCGSAFGNGNAYAIDIVTIMKQFYDVVSASCPPAPTPSCPHALLPPRPHYPIPPLQPTPISLCFHLASLHCTLLCACSCAATLLCACSCAATLLCACSSFGLLPGLSARHHNASARIRVGGHVQTVPRGAGAHVVAHRPRLCLPLPNPARIRHTSARHANTGAFLLPHNSALLLLVPRARLPHPHRLLPLLGLLGLALLRNSPATRLRSEGHGSGCHHSRLGNSIRLPLSRLPSHCSQLNLILAPPTPKITPHPPFSLSPPLPNQGHGSGCHHSRLGNSIRLPLSRLPSHCSQLNLILAPPTPKITPHPPFSLSPPLPNQITPHPPFSLSPPLPNQGHGSGCHHSRLGNSIRLPLSRLPSHCSQLNLILAPPTPKITPHPPFSLSPPLPNQGHGSGCHHSRLGNSIRLPLSRLPSHCSQLNLILAPPTPKITPHPPFSLSPPLPNQWSGDRYPVQAIITPDFRLNETMYTEQNLAPFISVFFALCYGLGFAALTATVVHVALWYGPEIYQRTMSAATEVKPDVHTRLMRRYPKVPWWWFLLLLLANIAVCIAFLELNAYFQLPWWGLLLSAALSLFFTLPIGIVTATTNQQPGLNIITEMIWGYIRPGEPIGNVCFKTYGYISMTQAIAFLQDFKLGHYMKIPPQAMFVVQVFATLLASLVNLGTSWWLYDTVENGLICKINDENFPENSPWTCPTANVFYSASIIWGLIGPERMFGPSAFYNNLNWWFLGGALAPIPFWAAHKMWPRQVWLTKVHIPVMLTGVGMMPPASPINYLGWLTMGFIFNKLIFTYRKVR